MTKKPLDKNLRIRLNEDEEKALVGLAQAMGEKSRCSVVRRMIREVIGQGPDLLGEGLQVFRDAVGQLAALGRNVNQIARHLNTDGSLENAALTQLLSGVTDQLDALKHELGEIILRSRHRWCRKGSQEVIRG